MTDKSPKVDEKGKIQKVVGSLVKARAPGGGTPAQGEGQPKKP